MWALSILYAFTKTLPAVIDSNFVSVCVCMCLCIQLATTLKYCLRGLCGGTQQNTLFYFFDTLTQLLAAEIQYEHLNELEQQVHIALSRLERGFRIPCLTSGIF